MKWKSLQHLDALIVACLLPQFQIIVVTLKNPSHASEEAIPHRTLQDFSLVGLFKELCWQKRQLEAL